MRREELAKVVALTFEAAELRAATVTGLLMQLKVRMDAASSMDPFQFRDWLCGQQGISPDSERPLDPPLTVIEAALRQQSEFEQLRAEAAELIGRHWPADDAGK